MPAESSGQPKQRKECKVELPVIGDIITSGTAMELCRHYKLDHLVSRIECTPEKYADWQFDGCSCLPDEIMGFFTGCDWREITYGCCLPHDLRYAYGESGNEKERKEADEELYSNLVNKAGMKEWRAAAFLAAVRIGGVEDLGLSFSWGFAHKPAQ